MKPLKIAVIVKNSPAALQRGTRNMGMWSYPVPEFTWDFLTPGKSFILDTRELMRQGYDLIFHEDGGAWGEYRGNALPVIYYAIDSTLTYENHYLPRLQQAGRADLVMVDHDKLDRFKIQGRRDPIQLSYCVNDQVFKPDTRRGQYDVAFHCGSSPDRAEVRQLLHNICGRHDWSYSSGTLGLTEYAQSLARHKIVVNVPRNPDNRPHRVLDAMACKVCLLSMPFPTVPGEWFISWQHYFAFFHPSELEDKIAILLRDGKWEQLAEAGYNLIMKYHTWSKRAGHLRDLISRELAI